MNLYQEVFMREREMCGKNNSSYIEKWPFLCPNFSIWRFILITILFISINNNSKAQGFSHYKELTIQSNHVSGGPHIDFPLMIRHADNDLRHTSSGGHVQSLDGFDIEFRDVTGTIVLSHETEFYLPTTGEIVAWVKIPILVDNVNTIIRMYYGNTQYVASINSPLTWSNGYKAVYHLNDNLYEESTGNVGALTSTGTAVNNGVFANGVEIESFAQPNHEYLDSPIDSDLHISGDVTLDIWVQINSFLTNFRYENNLMGVGGKGADANKNFYYWLSIDCRNLADKRIRSYWEYDNAEEVNEVSNAPVFMTEGTWSKITLVRNTSTKTIKFYLDGNMIGTPVGYINDPIGGDQSYLRLGNDQDWNQNTLNGTLDEARISNVIRSDEWIKTEYNSQRTFGSFDILTDIFSFYEIGDPVELCNPLTDNTAPILQCPTADDISILPDPTNCQFEVMFNVDVEEDCINSMQPSTPTGYIYEGTMNGHFYYRSNDSYDWATSLTLAESAGGHLATISSLEEDSLLNRPSSHFIGFTDEETEGEFKWVNGEAVNYINWKAGEPNNYQFGGGVGEHVVVKRSDSQNRWNDTRGIASQGFFHHLEIEYDTTLIYGIKPGDKLPYGQHTVSFYVVDIAGNQSNTCTFDVEYIDPFTPTLSASILSNPSSCLASDGVIALSAVDGTYLLQGSGIPDQNVTFTGGSYNLTGLSAGAYNDLQITNGCSSSSNNPSVILSEPPTPSLAISSFSTPTSCGGNNGMITISTDAIDGDYTIVADNGLNQLVNFASGIGTIFDLYAGNYNNLSISVNGCVNTEVVNHTLSDPSNPSLSISSYEDPTTCGGSEGSITLSTDAGDGDYTVEADGGLSELVSFVSGIGNISNLIEGDYNNLRIIINGCTSTDLVNQILSDPSTPSLSISSYEDPTTCGGSEGSITLSTDAGDGDYTVEADGGLSELVSFVSGIGTISNLIEGDYNNLRITVNGCTSTDLVNQILSDPSTPSLSISSYEDPTTCGGSDGSITLSTDAADGDYTIASDGGLSELVSFVSGIGTISNLIEGDYNNLRIIVNGCTSTDLVNQTLSDPSTPSLSISSYEDPTTCGGSEGSITLSTDAVDGDYTVEADGGLSELVSFVSGIGTISNLNEGDYNNLRITVNGCTSTDLVNQILSDPSTPTLSISSYEDPTTCGGTEGSITLSTDAVVGNYTVEADGGLSELVSFVSGIGNISDLIEGDYNNLRITVNGCTSTDLVNQTLSDPSNPSLSITSYEDPTTCGGSEGSITLSTDAVDGDYTVEADGGLSELVSFVSGIGTISNLIEGDYNNYRIIVNGCTSTDLVNQTLSDPSNPTLSISSYEDPTTCGGTEGSVTLSTDAVDGDYTVEADGGLSELVSFISSIGTISNLIEGDYNNLRITVNGCTSNDLVNQTLSDPSNPSLSISSYEDPTTCGGSEGFINLSTNVQDGDYMVQGFAGFSQLVNFSGGIGTLHNLAADDYIDLEITVNGCTSTENEFVTLNNPTVPTISVAGQTNLTSCGGNDGSITLNFTDIANGTYDISYSGGTYENMEVINDTTIINGLAFGNYSNFSITNQFNCVSPAAVNFVQIQNPVSPTIAISDQIHPTGCGNSNGSIYLSFTAISDGNHFVYYGSGDSVLVNVVSNQAIIEDLNAGIYENFYIRINNCQSIDDVSTELLDSGVTPNPPQGNSTQTFCPFQTLTLSDIVMLETDIIWYESEAASDPLDITIELFSGETYYGAVQTEGCESSRTAVLIIKDDTTDPIITSCPEHITSNADIGSCETELTLILPEAYDNCSSMVSYSNSYSGNIPTAVFSVGQTLISWTATDESGNIATCVQEINIVDEQQPTLGIDSLTVQMSGCQYELADLTDMLEIQDNCTSFENLIISSNPEIGSVFTGDTTVTYSITDEADNTDQFVLHLELVSTDALDISCSEDTLAVADIGNCGTSLEVSLPTYSGCNDVTVSFIQGEDIFESGYYPKGVTVLEWLIFDSFGNNATCSTNVTVESNVTPTITCPENLIVQADPNECSAFISFELPEVDGFCEPLISNSINDSEAAFGTLNIGEFTITYNVQDEVESLSCSFNISITDETIPTITCPPNVEQVGNEVLLDLPVIDEFCTELTFVNDYNFMEDASGSYPLGISIVTWTVTAPNDSTSSCVTEVEIHPGPANVSAGDDAYLESIFEYTLQGQKPVEAIGTWTLVKGSGNIVLPTDSNSLITDLGFGENTFEWTVDLGYYGIYSDQISVFVRDDLVPSGFSPNGDGVNDVFEIRGIEFFEGPVKVMIFNRNGTKIFSSENYKNNWDGDQLPVDTYFLIVEYPNGETVSKSIEVKR